MPYSRLFEDCVRSRTKIKEKAKDMGVSFKLNTVVKHIERQNGGFYLHTSENGKRSAYTFDVLIGADGYSSL